MSFKPTSFHLLERGNNSNLITWTYPTLPEESKILIQQTCFSEGLEAADLFYYKRCQKSWIYIKQFAENNKIGAFIITSLCYKPDLYKVICDLFVRKYLDGSTGVDLVKLYLKIYISNGICLKENSPETLLKLGDFPSKTGLKGLIKNLGIEIILLYNALLIKKQILVYHPKVEELQQALHSITKLVSHRKPDDILQPLVQNITELKKTSTFYLIGTTNSTLLKQQSSFHLLVNLHSLVIDVSSKSKESFQMSSLHKDIAHLMMHLAESESSESEVIEAILKKTMDLFKYLKTFVNTEEGGKKIIVKEVESKIKNKNLQTFLINLAIAKNIMVVI